MTNALSRFKRPGGFLNLIQILETSDPAKKKNLLHLVGTEDPGWAHLVRIKTLSLERIMKWPTSVLCLIFHELPDPICLVLFLSFSEELKRRFSEVVPEDRLRELKKSAENQIVTPHESFASVVKLIQTARELESTGKYSFTEFDPSLVIDEKLAG